MIPGARYNKGTAMTGNLTAARRRSWVGYIACFATVCLSTLGQMAVGAQDDANKIYILDRGIAAAQSRQETRASAPGLDFFSSATPNQTAPSDWKAPLAPPDHSLADIEKTAQSAGKKTAPERPGKRPTDIKERSAIIDHAIFRQLGEFFKEITDAMHWTAVGHLIRAAVFENMFLTFLGLAGFLFGAVCFQQLLLYTDRTVDSAIRQEHISSRNTGRLFLATLCAAFLLWSPLLVVGVYFRIASSFSASPSFVFSLGNSLISLFVVGTCFKLSQEFFSKGGLSEAVFGVKFVTARYVLMRTELAVFVAAPLIGLFVFVSTFADGRWYDSVGRIAFLGLAGLLIIQFQKVFAPGSTFYRRVVNDESVARMSWVHHRHLIYWIGISICLITVGLTVSGWFALAKTFSVRMVWMSVSVAILLSLRTILDKNADEWIRKSSFIEDLGQTTEAGSTVRSTRAQSFVERYSAAAKQGVGFIVTMLFLATSFWIWSDVLTIPKQALDWEAGNLVAGGQLFVVAVVALFLARQLPGFLVWICSHHPATRISNPRLTSWFIAAGVLYLGAMLACRILSVSIPVVPWLGTLLLISGLVAGRTLIADSLAGVILLFDRRVQEGDSIEIDGRFGRVDEIRLQTTIVEDNLGTRMILPNRMVISEKVTKTRTADTLPLQVDVSIPRGSDAHQAQVVMMLVAQRDPGVVDVPPPHVRFEGFRGDELKFQIRMLVLATVDGETTRARLEEKLAIEFERHAICPNHEHSSPATIDNSEPGIYPFRRSRAA